MQVDRELSARLAEAAASINFRRPAPATQAKPESGWRIAYTAWLAMANLVGDGLYVEGWAVSPDTGEVFEHGWIEQADRIVDPTRWAEALAYFPGLRFTGAEAYRMRLKTAGAEGDAFPLARRLEVWDGQPDPSYHAAYEEALAFVESKRGDRSQSRPAAEARQEEDEGHM